jgi:hypothetical protein
LKTEYEYDEYIQTENIAEDTLTVESQIHFREAINNAWKKLDEYYSKMDESPIYASFVILNPSQG